MLKRLAIVLALVLGLFSPAEAGFYDGLVAFDRGDYQTALREFRPLAEQGNAFAQYNLGIMYYHSRGVPQDHTEAARWFRKAAEKNHLDAQFNLGRSYGDGMGVPQDNTEAVRWYRKAAEQGHGAAQTNLGAMYEQGMGVPQDYVQAHMWSNLAAAQGIEMARENRDKVAKRMTPEQIAEAQRLAREWRPKVQPKPDDNIQLVQYLLIERGYDPGPLDGFMGERTLSAIASFKADMASAGALSKADQGLLVAIEGLPK